MKNRTTLLFSFLFIIIILLSFFLYRTKKQFSAYVEHIKVISTLFVSSYEHQSRIDDVKKLKSDTTKDYRVSIYTEINRDGVVSNTGFRLFYLVAVLNRDDKNEKEINKLLNTYDVQIDNIRLFLYRHHNFDNISKKDVDTLISYYKKLKTITEQIEKTKIEL